MENDFETFTLIKKHFQLGLSIDETYAELCEKFDMKFIPIDEIYSWLDEKTQEHRKYWIQSHIREMHSMLLQLINNVYTTLQKAIYYGNEKNVRNSWQLCYPNTRYGFELRNFNENELRLFDYFHDQEKRFPIMNVQIDHSIQLFPISVDRFLIMTQFYEEPNTRSTFYLMQVDFVKEECRVLDQLQTDLLNVTRVVFDEEDRQKFVLMFYNPVINENALLTIQGQIENNLIVINGNETIRPIETYMDLQILRGNSLMILNQSYNRNEEGKRINKFDYVEVNLSNGNTRTVELELSDEVKTKDITSGGYTYQNNSFLITTMDRKYQTYIFEANLETFEGKLFPVGCQKMPFGHDCQVDENGILTIMTSNGSITRYAMGKPEPLQNLCWFTIRRHALLTENPDFHQQALERLPMNSQLKPFYVEPRFETTNISSDRVEDETKELSHLILSKICEHFYDEIFE